MAGPFGRRRERRDADMQATIERSIEAGVEKAMSPAIAQAGMMSSGATYPIFQRSQDSPFNQVGPGQGFQPLPRPPGMFDSGFGPANPLFPDAIDPLLPSGRTMARRTEYLIAANINLIDRRVPWSVLRGLAEDVDIIQRCIQIVQDAIVGLDWSWGFSPQIIQQIMTEDGVTNSSKASALARAKYGDELMRIQTFFDYPDKRMGFTFSQWLTDIIYSHLVYDGIVIAPEYNLGGELTSLSTIDTSTIKILLDNQGFIPHPPAPAYQQILYGFPRGEFQAENVSQDGNIPDAFTNDQLAYYIRRPRPNNIYGYSQVEECINIATIYMERQAWLHAEYTNGVTPRMVITTDGAEHWTPEQLSYYERSYNDQFSGQTQRRHNFMLMRPGMKAEQLKGVDEAYKNTYDEWLVMQIAAKFGIPQGLMGVKGPATLGNGHEKGQADQYESYATDALRNFLIECINDMARRFLGVGPELTITANGGGNDNDTLTRSQSDQIDINSGIRTRNEIRAERGIPLMNEPEADQLGVTVGTGVTFLTGTLAAQQAQQGAGAAGASNGTTAQPGGVSGDASNADEPAGLGGTNATVNADGVANTSGTSTAVGGQETIANITSKDDERQPAIEKELASFERFAKARVDRNSWRDFEFTKLGTYQAAQLNGYGRQGNLTGIRHAVAKASGNADALIEWYNDGADGQIEWGSPGDFDACVAIAGDHLDNPEGFCNLRHQDATGGAPGTEDATKGGPGSGPHNGGVAGISGSNLDSSDGKTVSLSRLKAGDHVVYQNTIHEYIGKLSGEHWARPLHVGGGAGELTSLGQTSAGPLSDRAGIFRVNSDAVEREKSMQAANKADHSAERGVKANSDDVAFLAPGGQIYMPEPLKTGDKIIVQHADKTKDIFPVVDASEPTPTTPDQEDGKDVEHQIAQIDADEEDEVEKIVAKMIAPELERLREAYGLLEEVRREA